MQERIHWIDVLKGIGILLVALSHQQSPLKLYIFSFHMPLFFFISGFVYHRHRQTPLGRYVKRRAQTIAAPYFYFSLLTWPFWVLVGRRYGHDAHYQVSNFKPLLGTLYGNGHGQWMLHNIPLWFLACLFTTSVLFALIYRAGKTNRRLALSLVLLSVLGYLDSLYMPVRLPWAFDVALTATVFYGAGFLFCALRPTGFTVGRAGGAGWLVLSLGVVALCTWLNTRVDMNTNRYGNVFLFYLGAFGGIAGCAALAMWIGKSTVLEYLGRNSLIIFAFHSVGSSFAKAPVHFLFKTPIETTHGSLAWALVFAAGSVLFTIPVIEIINRFFPFLIGRARRRE